MENQIRLTGSSMEALAQEFRGIAHNLANVNTVGFKRLGNSFANILRSQVNGAGLTGEVTGSTSIDFRQGALVRTGRPMDLAIQGKGFFVIETPQGELYTRNGTFRLNQNGQLVDSANRTVAGDAGPIVIPPTTGTTEVNVAPDGTVSVRGARIGKLRLVEFEDLSVLKSVGEGCYRPAGGRPAEAAGTSVHQGYQEASNVSPVNELVRLITVTRLYQANAKTLQSTDERMKHLLQVAMGS